MIWLSWRQFRTQALIGVAALAVLAIYLVILGFQIRHTYHADLAQCHGACGLADFTHEYQVRVYLLDGLLILVPVLVGAFWGAPLVARELEAGTHRLVWNQSVTRTRWLAVKLLVVGLAGMAVTGLASLLLTWAASPYDRVAGERFTALAFGSRNIAPVGYVAFAFLLGTVLGLALRRTVAAMALTIAVVAVVQVLMPTVVRPHLSTPVTADVPVTVRMVRNLTFLGNHGNVGGVSVPDAWVVSTSDLLAAGGRRVDLADYNRCVSGSLDHVGRCLAALHLHVRVAYQPADRYWSFQWRESAIYAALAALLAGLGLWRIRRRLT